MELVKLIIFMLIFALICFHFTELSGFGKIALGCAFILAVTQVAMIYIQHKGDNDPWKK